jgi:hypothetical protein
MTEAVDAVLEGSVPPQELIMAWRCRQWNALPEAGGVFDQPYTLMERMEALSNIYDTMSHYANAQGEQIHGLSHQERRLLKWLKDEKIWQT